MDDLKRVNRQLDRLRRREQVLLQEKDDILGRTLVTCGLRSPPRGTIKEGGCGKESRIRDVIYVQTHWYVPPSGCTEGAYWKEGEGQFDCPHCGVRNRLYELPEIEELKHLFSKVKDTYSD